MKWPSGADKLFDISIGIIYQYLVFIAIIDTNFFQLSHFIYWLLVYVKAINLQCTLI